MPRLDPPATVGLLFSGGLDSCVLAGELLRQGLTVQPLYVAGRLAWEVAELAAARQFLAAIAQPRLAELVVLEMPVDDLYGDHWSIHGRDVPDAHSTDDAVYLPGRNPLLLLKARMWCQLHGVSMLALGCLGSNPFADASETFLVQFGRILDEATSSTVAIRRPLEALSKEQVLALGRELPLQWSFSCIQPHQTLHCGRCNKCAERRKAFHDLGLTDPTHYFHPDPLASANC